MTRHNWLYVLIACALVIIYFAFNPADSRWFPQCPFFMITGWRCPGCGSQRAIHALLHLDVVRAFHYNALLVGTLPLLLFLAYVELQRKKNPRLYTRVHKPIYILFYGILILLWFLMRNIYGW